MKIVGTLQVQITWSKVNSYSERNSDDKVQKKMPTLPFWFQVWTISRVAYFHKTDHLRTAFVTSSVKWRWIRDQSNKKRQEKTQEKMANYDRRKQSLKNPITWFIHDMNTDEANITWLLLAGFIAGLCCHTWTEFAKKWGPQLNWLQDFTSLGQKEQST
jgi:hypothetical protein